MASLWSRCIFIATLVKFQYFKQYLYRQLWQPAYGTSSHAIRAAIVTLTIRKQRIFHRLIRQWLLGTGTPRCVGKTNTHTHTTSHVTRCTGSQNGELRMCQCQGLSEGKLVVVFLGYVKPVEWWRRFELCYCILYVHWFISSVHDYVNRSYGGYSFRRFGSSGAGKSFPPQAVT